MRVCVYGLVLNETATGLELRSGVGVCGIVILSFTFFLNFEVLCFRFRFSFFFFFEFFCELWIAEADAVRAYLYSSSYTPSSIPPISILFPLSSTFYIFLSIIYLLCLRFIHCLSPLSSVAFF